SVCSWLRRRWISLRRWATWVLASASRLMAWARSASASAARAKARALSLSPWAMAAWARARAWRASSICSRAYWSASAPVARITACWAPLSSLVGGGIVAQAASAQARTVPASRRRICEKLGVIGEPARDRVAGILVNAPPHRNAWRIVVAPISIPGARMDIGYFLKLMVEKNASDMFLTTGAPVYIKIEGRLHALGNTGLPPGMVKKIAYSLMDEGQVPIFERELELNIAYA